MDDQDKVKDEPTQSDPLAGLSRDVIKDHPMVKGIMTQLREAQEQADALRSEQEKAKAEKARTEAEARGDYEKALAEIQAAKDADLAKAQAEVEAMRQAATDAKLSAEIARLGLSGNPIVEAGIKALFAGQSETDDPAAWAAEFAKSDHCQSLSSGKIVQPTPQPAPAGGRSGGGDLAHRLADKDKSVRDRARDELVALRDTKPAEYARAISDAARLARSTQ